MRLCTRLDRRCLTKVDDCVALRAEAEGAGIVPQLLLQALFETGARLRMAVPGRDHGYGLLDKLGGLRGVSVTRVLQVRLARLEDGFVEKLLYQSRLGVLLANYAARVGGPS